jgi:hypothetical protein
MRLICVAALLVAAAIIPTSAAYAQRVDSAAYVVRFGTDTLAMERWVRTADRLDAVSVTRAPQTAVRRYSLRFGADGRVTHAAIGDGELTPVATPGAIPMAGGFYAPQAVALAQAARARDTLTTVQMLSGGGAVQPFRARRLGPDIFELLNPGGSVTARAHMTADGRLVFLETGGSTTVKRVDWFDIDAWAREFADRDARGVGLGPLSTRDTARLAVAGANIAIDYGRPAARGRTIFGGLVPWERVWRTGADDATQLTVDRAVRIGDIRLEPGTYSLYTIPARERWLLGINRGTGMAAAMSPDPAEDVGRVAMAARELPEHVERFTMRLEPQAGGALLRMQWERTEVVVPIVVEGR